MLVSYLLGIDRDHLRQTLQTHYDRAFNLRGGGTGTAFDRLLAYLDWAQSVASALRLLISRADIERLVLTSGYRTLLTGIPGLAGAGSAPVVNGLPPPKCRISTISRHAVLVAIALLACP